MSRRFGLLGGAFNPPHIAHLRVALDVLEALGLERMLFLPSGGHPFKRSDVLAPAPQRLEMTRLAIADEPRFELCPLESKKAGTSYTIDTLQALNAANPGVELVFLLGTDLLAELHLWRSWRDLIDWAHLCILVRPGSEDLFETSEAGAFLARHRVATPADLDRNRLGRNGLLLHPVTPLTISSTDLRRRVAEGRSLRYLIPDSVISYMSDHRLYLTRSLHGNPATG